MTRMAKQVGIAAALVAAIALAGCASTGASDGEAQDRFATLILDNDSPLTVNVYAIRHSGRFRLGTVTGLNRKQLPIRSHMLDTGAFFQVLIEPLGGQQSYYTDRILVERDEVIRLRVSNFIR